MKVKLVIMAGIAAEIYIMDVM